MGLKKIIEGLGGGAASDVGGAVRDVAQVWTVNADQSDARDVGALQAALGQFGAEFGGAGVFNRVVDGINRLPRPMLAFGVVALFVMAMIDPVWFGARMTGLALVPEPLWILIGAVVTFYFGSRHTEKRLAIGAAKHVADVAARVPKVVDAIRDIEALTPRAADITGDARAEGEAIKPEGNPALVDWRGIKMQE
jgi:hypothetical protein